MRRISLLCVTCAAAMMVAGGCASMSGTLKGGLIGGGGGTAVGAGIGALAGGGKGAGFEGGQTPLARRLPKLPGFRNFNRVEYLPVNVSRLDAKFEAGDVVDGESLKAKGIIKHADALVKVLGDGEITKALTVRVDKVSASAKAKIEAAGGKVEEPC